MIILIDKKNPKGGSMQNSRIKRQSNCIRSSTVHLGQPAIKRPLIGIRANQRPGTRAIQGC